LYQTNRISQRCATIQTDELPKSHFRRSGDTLCRMPRLLTFSGLAGWGWSARQTHRAGERRVCGTKAKPLVTHLAGGFAMSRPLSILSTDSESRYSAGTRLVPTPFPNDLAGGHTWARRDQKRDQTWARKNSGPFFLRQAAGSGGRKVVSILAPTAGRVAVVVAVVVILLPQRRGVHVRITRRGTDVRIAG
jgi:hypothetical protein